MIISGLLGFLGKQILADWSVRTARDLYLRKTTTTTHSLTHSLLRSLHSIRLPVSQEAPAKEDWHLAPIQINTPLKILPPNQANSPSNLFTPTLAPPAPSPPPPPSFFGGENVHH